MKITGTGSFDDHNGMLCFGGGNAVGEGTHDERNTNPMPDDPNVDRRGD